MNNNTTNNNVEMVEHVFVSVPKGACEKVIVGVEERPRWTLGRRLLVGTAVAAIGIGAVHMLHQEHERRHHARMQEMGLEPFEGPRIDGKPGDEMYAFDRPEPRRFGRKPEGVRPDPEDAETEPRRKPHHDRKPEGVRPEDAETEPRRKPHHDRKPEGVRRDPEDAETEPRRSRKLTRDALEQPAIEKIDDTLFNKVLINKDLVSQKKDTERGDGVLAEPKPRKADDPVVVPDNRAA